jgi:hypothetical protein
MTATNQPGAANLFEGWRSGSVSLERRKAPAGSDAATVETVRMMCDYIQQGIDDQHVRDCADYAFKRFGGGIDQPAAKCWAVFWWVKHCVKFRLDEATMFRIGERNQQDLLIAPPVLTRMKNPAEDCDGFTMLIASMCAILGVPVVIATVAASPQDPARWSHVFPCALLPGDQVMPLDASHGVGPGWMVPKEHIFRWQAYGLDGRPVDVEPMPFQGLHNYARRGGLGDYGDCPDGYYLSANAGTCLPNGTPDVPGSTPVVSGAPAVASLPSTSSGADWTAFLQSIAKQGLNIVSSVVTPPAYQSTARDANGNLISTTVRNTATGSAAATLAAQTLGNSSILWIGGGLLALVLVTTMVKNRD